MQLDIRNVDAIIKRSLREDIGRGDITSNIIIDADSETEFFIKSRQSMVLCGVDIAKRVFELVDSNIKTESILSDGDEISDGELILKGQGNARSILAAERIALNLLRQMCGVATFTKRFVDEIADTNAKILDTRKTTPGLRVLQKYAVTVGGGYNHRFGLDDGILIKDNHISVCGGVAKAIERAREKAPSLTKIEIECDTLEQVKEAVKAKPDVIMLDNMSVDTMKEAVQLVVGAVKLEASGNVNLKTVRAIAQTGVDYISVGAITNSPEAVDIGLDIDL